MNAWLVIFFLPINIPYKQPIDSKNPICMASLFQGIPHKEGNPTTSNSPHTKEDIDIHT